MEEDRILGKAAIFTWQSCPEYSFISETVTHDPAIFVASSGNEPADIAQQLPVLPKYLSSRTFCEFATSHSFLFEHDASWSAERRWK